MVVLRRVPFVGPLLEIELACDLILRYLVGDQVTYLYAVQAGAPPGGDFLVIGLL